MGWWGAKQLGGYRQLESAELRLAACRRARRQGSVHLPLWRRLAAAAAAGRLTVLEGWEVAGAHQAEGAEGAATKGPAWLLHLQRREGALPAAAGPTLFQQAVAAAAAAAASAPDALAEQQFDEQPAELTANLVWLACGRAYDAAGEAVLRQLAAQAPVPRTGGYPWLDDEALCWPGAPVYLLGRGALLSVGPCAGALWRQRGAGGLLSCLLPACLATI